jgi:hypothetical protein
VNPHTRALVYPHIRTHPNYEHTSRTSMRHGPTGHTVCEWTRGHSGAVRIDSRYDRAWRRGKGDYSSLSPKCVIQTTNCTPEACSDVVLLHGTVS